MTFNHREMKQFLSFVKKEFQHIFRDRRTMLIVLVLPVVEMLLFGYAVSTEIHSARVAVIGDLSDPQVKKMVERIENNKCLEVTAFLSSTTDVDAEFRKNNIDAAVCFCPDFGRELVKNGKADIRVIGDGSDPNTAQMISGYIMGVVQSEQAGLDASAGGVSPQSLPVQLMYNPAMKSAYNFVPGVMGLIMMLICSMMTSISIVREKETGTMELLLVSPLRPLMIIVSKVLPYVAVSAVNFVTILLLARFAMGVPLRGSLPLLSLIVLLFIFTSLSLGLMISVLASTQRTALLLSGMGLMMPTVMLSGIIFPCESMPAILQCVSHVIPAKWFVIMVKKVMIQGVGFAYIIKEFTILASVTLFLLAVSIRKFRIRL